MHLAQYLILIFTAFGGVLLAFYIHYKKTSHETMVCPLHSNCEVVIYSKYSNFFGIPVEIMGLFYYGTVVLTNAFFLVFPSFISPISQFIIFIVSTTAFLFSAYLVSIQAFALKQWCTWCLMSAGLCGIIFVTEVVFMVFVSKFDFAALLVQYLDLLTTLNFFGVALGLGAATIIDIFLFKFLKDVHISEWEADMMHTLTQVIWFALALILLTSVGLYIPQTEELNQSATFLVKMVAVAMIIINGMFLNFLVEPKFVKMLPLEKDKQQLGGLHHYRKIAFALAGVLIVSWYSVFVLGTLKNVTLNFSSLLLVYIFLLGLAVVASQVMEWFFVKRAELS